MTELSFLIQLLLNESLPLDIKKEVAERIKDVEQRLVAPALQPMVYAGVNPGRTPGAQAPSTQRILDEIAMHPEPPMAPQAPSTAAAAQALQDRNQAIRQATSGKFEQGRTSPRKF